MDLASVIVWMIGLLLGVVAYFHPKKCHLEGLTIAWKQAVSMVPRIVMAVLVSGFFSVIVPTDQVAAWIGKESGIQGIMVASMVGGFTPGGAIICFPIAVVLYRTGAGIPQLVAFLTAWSVFAFHRIIAYEIPMMGVRFAAVRVLSSIVLPPLAGVLVAIIEGDLSMGF